MHFLHLPTLLGGDYLFPFLSLSLSLCIGKWELDVLMSIQNTQTQYVNLGGKENDH